MKREKPNENSVGHLDTQGAGEQDKRVRPFFGRLSLGLSIAFLLSLGYGNAYPHGLFIGPVVATTIGSGPCAFLAGFMGLRRREQPRYPAWVGIACGALYLGLFLVYVVPALGLAGALSGGL
jgi:hypothetical protein